jgi:hypothetical protein
MRIHLRQTTTHFYFQGLGEWTTDLELALDFGFIDRALQYARSCCLGGLELAFAFDAPGQVIIVPLERATLRFSAA